MNTPDAGNNPGRAQRPSAPPPVTATGAAGRRHPASFKVDSKDHVVTYYVKKGGTVTGIKAHMIDNNHEFYIAINPGYGGAIRMYYQRKG